MSKDFTGTSIERKSPGEVESGVGLRIKDIFDKQLQRILAPESGTIRASGERWARRKSEATGRELYPQAERLLGTVLDLQERFYRAIDRALALKSGVGLLSPTERIASITTQLIGPFGMSSEALFHLASRGKPEGEGEKDIHD